MGQAFDEHGNSLGPTVIGETKGEVLEKLEELYPGSAEVRIKKLHAAVEEMEAKGDELSREIVRRIDARMGAGWAKQLAEALDPDSTWPA
jgi:hypothetical protein